MASNKNRTKECIIPGCDHTDIRGRGWCSMHYMRWLRWGSPYTVNERNGRPLVKGLKSPYLNLYLYKKNRIIKLRQSPICEYCHKKPATLTHHKDFKKDNHTIENLMSLCGSKCHGSIHTIKKQLDNMRDERNKIKPYTEEEINDLFYMDQHIKRHRNVEILF